MTPVLSYSQALNASDKSIPDSVVHYMVNDFLIAINSGDREIMHDFIVSNYDQIVLKRIPFFAVVALNMGFYYETGGLGYELIKTLHSESGSINAELYNRLTKTTLKFNFPVSEAPLYKINRFITAESIISPSKEMHSEQLSDDEITTRIGNCLTKLIEDEEFSGAVMVSKNGRILVKKAFGKASKTYEVPNQIDTKFNIASVGKVFTGLAVAQLVEQEKLSFDDPISNYLSADWLNPEVSEKIQIKHLLTHTSGLGDYFRDAYKQNVIPYFKNLDDYKSLIVDDTLMFEPGTRFSYSNTGMLLLGVVIENVTNEEYFTYLKKKIFEPIGMFNTDGYSKDIPVKNRATGYTKTYEDGEVVWNNHQYTRIMRGSPSGGIYSTIEDLHKYDIALRSNKLLSPEYSKMLFEGRADLNASFHSIGFFVSEGVAGRIASHSGDGRGMNCQFKMYLDSGYTVIVLSNYSAPSANIVANVASQLIAHRSRK
jgi:CubicO group peptidase (beta-lactamase class C family)